MFGGVLSLGGGFGRLCLLVGCFGFWVLVYAVSGLLARWFGGLVSCLGFGFWVVVLDSGFD